MFDKAVARAHSSYLCAKANIKEGFDRLKNDEKALSGVVVAVLLVALAIVLVVFLNEGLRTFVTGIWSKVSGQGDKVANPVGGQ